MSDLELVRLIGELKSEQGEVRARQESTIERLDELESEIKSAKTALYRAAWVIFVTLAAQVASKFLGMSVLLDLFTWRR